MEYTFSIIIPSWNNLPFLQNLIESIRENSYHSHQIIVHINDGSDGTLQWVQEQDDIDHSHSQENIGICYGMNIARQLLKTDYLVYINDDMYMCPDWDSHLLDEINSLPDNRFFLSGTLIEATASNECVIQHDFGSNLESFAKERLLQEYAGFPFKDWNGATWPFNVVHKDVWDLVGGYSSEFFPGMYSDPDFSKKLWDLGVRYFKGISASRAYHMARQSTGRLTNRNNGRSTFLLKWGVSSNYFTRQYLQLGSPFHGALPEPSRRRSIFHKLKLLFHIFLH